jgi:hypothetical protein
MGLLSSIFGSSSRTTSTSSTNTTNNALDDSRVGADGGSIAVGKGATLSQTENNSSSDNNSRTQIDNSVRNDVSGAVLDIVGRSQQRIVSDSLSTVSDGQATALRFAGGVVGDALDLATVSGANNRAQTIALLDAAEAVSRRSLETVGTISDTAVNSNSSLARSLSLGSFDLALSSSDKILRAAQSGNDVALAASQNVLRGAAQGLDFGSDALSFANRNTSATIDALTASQIESGRVTRSVLDLVEGIATDSARQNSASREGTQETISRVLEFQTAGDTKIGGDLIKYGALAAVAIGAALIFRNYTK